MNREEMEEKARHGVVFRHLSFLVFFSVKVKKWEWVVIVHQTYTSVV